MEHEGEVLASEPVEIPEIRAFSEIRTNTLADSRNSSADLKETHIGS